MNISLRKLNNSFITTKYINWLNDKKLMIYSQHRHFKHTYNSCKKYVDYFEKSNNALYAIIDTKSNVRVGSINEYIDTYNGLADIGILVGISGKCYGYAAWQIMIEKLFSNKNIRKLSAGTMADNMPMLKYLKNLE